MCDGDGDWRGPRRRRRARCAEAMARARRALDLGEDEGGRTLRDGEGDEGGGCAVQNTLAFAGKTSPASREGW